MTNLVKKLLEICLTILTKRVKSEHVVSSFHGQHQFFTQRLYFKKLSLSNFRRTTLFFNLNKQKYNISS